jgi:hypothetical protein
MRSIYSILGTRRDFLFVGGIAGLGLGSALRQSARGEETLRPRARNVVMVFLAGGPATIDMWDMKPDAIEQIRGEFRPRETAVPGIQICEHMPQLASSMHLATLVRSVTHSIAEHTQGAAYVMTGNRPGPASEFASLGSLSAKLFDSTEPTPSYIQIDDAPAAGAGALGAAHNPFTLRIGADGENRTRAGKLGLPEGFTITDLERRDRILARLDRDRAIFESSDVARQLDRYQKQAFAILHSDRINRALTLDDEPAPLRERYGKTPFGRGMLTARRLLEAGARFITIGLGDWDTHANNFSRLRTNLLPQLDRGLASLLSDLHDRGMLEETLVYCVGEFGRTPSVNGSAGRDHWAHSMTALVAGGGFRRGHVHGMTDADGADVTDAPCSPDDLSATLFAQLGYLPAEHVVDRTGRPIPLFRDGRPIAGIVQSAN